MVVLMTLEAAWVRLREADKAICHMFIGVGPPSEGFNQPEGVEHMVTFVHANNKHP